MQETLEPAPTEHAHPTIDLTRFGSLIPDLHQQICHHGRRVEITRPGCDDRCVLISKSELESLEQAVKIFADTQAFAEMSQNIKELLRAAGLVYEQPA